MLFESESHHPPTPVAAPCDFWYRKTMPTPSVSLGRGTRPTSSWIGDCAPVLGARITHILCSMSARSRSHYYLQMVLLQRLQFQGMMEPSLSKENP
ncbi:uncharacterized protein K460DRAFT_4628 [Cucurbitaria berberidis CBS 394.84]|uniref:Uncharacterized protein n=1 Tax=Cucurbitaria berberidis CBS 394.84 TaxID=1168544 RepID=A0A9P4LCB6_9PLEO|nr:uncharacterized protein K460DRAFT_4628 [Cucurbitaria berberidis CBS 394.84]KAF1849845.1 hypothetical protein K460DRAFT_4628 [Cucurbitaria berberidis CBS 394.84]